MKYKMSLLFTVAMYLMVGATSHLVPEQLSHCYMRLIQVSGTLPGLLRDICGFGGLLLKVSLLLLCCHLLNLCLFSVFSHVKCLAGLNVKNTQT